MADEMTQQSTVWGRFWRNPNAIIGMVILTGIFSLVISAPFVFPDGPFEMVGLPFSQPFGEFLFGTDMLGRSVAAGIAYGAQISLLVGTVSTLVIVLLGTVIGGLSGYYGGRVDTLMMRITEFFQTIPSFIGAIVIVAVLGSTLTHIIGAIAIVSWAPLARLVRAEVIRVKNAEFVHACVALGMKDLRIMMVQVLPNVLSTITVAGSLMVATAILFESGLSFLGLGDPNVMTWGFMVGAGRSAIRTAWWMVTIPGIAILLTVLAINLTGDALNEALNPRLKQ
ncbi:ABC transporter permease [Alcaligenes endophyticus]|uniref:ABC transporter permease n=1 Tax=Alcaligenes endophyticus TaxID=1929088 RepID=A0ABT8EHG8_9BURK|nr:ABC transporter permease [Alcaligenes endophyticus]MCX5592088.1 ABC transporter permease [Alcaligenes endophyticus]MDN4120735.1 ABC transporter permease [Alcaligenes endophyticus]